MFVHTCVRVYVDINLCMGMHVCVCIFACMHGVHICMFMSVYFMSVCERHM